MTAAKYLRVGFVLAAAVTVAAACSAFSDAEEPTPPPSSPDASPEASQTDGTTVIDATADAGDATAPCPTFEDDFSSGDTAKWAPNTASCTKAEIVFGSRDAGDNAVFLSCSAPPDAEAYQTMVKGSFPAVARTRVSFAFKIELTTSHVFAQLTHLFGEYGNLSMVATPANIELWNRRTGAMLTYWPAGDQTRWRSLVIVIEPKDPLGSTVSIKAELDGVPRTFDVVRDLDGGPSDFDLQIGPYANVADGEFKDAYDAVLVSSCP